jgi:hypothetical protein
MSATKRAILDAENGALRLTLPESRHIADEP